MGNAARLRAMCSAPYVVVFDCESDSLFSTLPGVRQEDKISFMQFTVISAVTLPSHLIQERASVDNIMSNAKIYNWWRDVAEEGSNPITSLLSLFDHADAIVGFNCNGFDFPLIKRFYNFTSGKPSSDQRYVSHRSKTLDLMSRVKDATGLFLKLNDLLQGNGLQTKCAVGTEAVCMWERGDREALKAYCDMDVLLTARLALLENLSVNNAVTIDSSVYGLRAFLAAQGSTTSNHPC